MEYITFYICPNKFNEMNELIKKSTIPDNVDCDVVNSIILHIRKTFF